MPDPRGPQLPGSPGGRAPRRAGYADSEATRLLCAGTYLDDAFRDAIVQELYVHEERVVAPSLGIDASRVLAHALRARRMESGAALLLVVLWLALLLATPLLGALFLLACVLVACASWAGGRSYGPVKTDYPGADATQERRRRITIILWLFSGMLLVLYAIMLIGVTAMGERTVDPGIGMVGMVGASGGVRLYEGWAGLVVPLAMAGVILYRRHQVIGALTVELSPETFARPEPDVAEQYEGTRFRRVRDLVNREQHSPLIMYHAQHPFLGAGSPYEPWTLAVQLRPREGQEQTRLDNRVVLEKVAPLVTKLRVPAAQGPPHLPVEVRDRLRGLELDECVFVQAEGLRQRSAAPYGPGEFTRQQAEAVEEGGETRRHFLRIRVGAWREEVVVTVFVRVHTQGGMLMLEFAPHVLRPIRPAFRAIDRIADSARRSRAAGRVVSAFLEMPAAAGRALLYPFRQVAFAWRIYVGAYDRAVPDGPWASVRELGSDQSASRFQEMDVSRYLKSVEDRVAGGVRQALAEAGWQTGEFEQKVINVSGGGVFIESARDSAIGIGDNHTISNVRPAPGVGLGGGAGGDGNATG
ncbi:hypothetical protein [Streptomyces zagrosensis]|uniref:Uncharacterized protein n=1 Tax=Streptomyces zagrosensis TaxID=1042984 RepID=A0A7W9UXW8_9ACTN|nr:hypothetical protein [Streptomyces zagrosensis]MBB5934771.1 hypothetical protein [Streptomyces zagrosensis]